MNYELIKATDDNIEYIKEAKLYNIFSFATNLEESEIDRINKYVDSHIPNEINDYKLIKSNDKIIGCVYVSNKDDGVLLDEIYIEEQCRGNGIGSDIIKKVLLENPIVYLWVYKANDKAIALYTRLGFNVLEETDSRYYMKYHK